MDEEQFNMEIRKFLKKVGITCQREIEMAVRKAVESGALSGGETLDVKVSLELEGVGLAVPIEGQIRLG